MIRSNNSVAVAFCFSQMVATVVLAESSDQSSPHPMDKVPIADGHVHLVDFLQNTGHLRDGKEIPPSVSNALPAGSRHLRLELLLSKMEE
jgi:hypothetical protein